MCVAAAIAIPAIVATAAIAGTTAMSITSAQQQAAAQKRAQKQSQREFDALLAQSDTSNVAEQADAVNRNATTREAQKILARTGGGTIQTSPLGVQSSPYTKKSLLGE